CGSGLKYKKCCSDKQVARAGSPIPGVSWDEFLTTEAHRMTAAHVDDLPMFDLVRVQIERLTGDARRTALLRFADQRAWSYAERLASDDDLRDQLIGIAIDGREAALA